MKKTLSLLLAVLMMLSVMAPVTVFAEIGPFPNETLTEESEDYTNYSDLYIISDTKYAQLFPAEGENPYSGASYDKATNTLTLNNVNDKYATLCVECMGDDFTINVIGYNELASIEAYAGNWGSGLTITGDGELVLDREKNGYGITLDGDYANMKLVIGDDVKLKVYADKENGCPSIYIGYTTAVNDYATFPAGHAFEEEVYKYTAEQFETLKVYSLDLLELIEGYDAAYTKDGVTYIAEKSNEAGIYWLYSVYYSKSVKAYIVDYYNDGAALNPTKEGFKKVKGVSYGSPLYDEANNRYIGICENENLDNKIPSTKIYVFDEFVGEELYLAYNLKNKPYVFYSDYVAEGEDRSVMGVYKAISDEKYGYFAKEDKNQTDLEGLVPVKTGEQKIATIEYYDDIVINNGGSLVEPKKITGIKVKNVSNGVKISWNTRDTATHYRIYRKLAGTDGWENIATLKGSDVSSYVDKTAKNGIKYTYTVRGYNKIGWGKYDKEGVSITFISQPYFSLKNTEKGVKVNWTKIPDVGGYRVYRKAAGSSKWTTICDKTKKLYIYDDTAKNGKEYTYKVVAIIGKRLSSGMTDSIKAINTPTLGKISNKDDGIKITWKTVSGADGYLVYRKTGNGDWVRIKKIKDGDERVFIDENVTNGKKYTYTVKAYDDHTTSGYNSKGLIIKRK